MTRAHVRLWVSAVVGLGFFVLPVPVGGRWTVAFDVAVKGLRTGWPEWVGAWCMLLLTLGAVAPFLNDRLPAWAAPLRAGTTLRIARVAGVLLGLVLWLQLGPEALLAKNTGGLTWGVLVASVAIIVPLGAAALNVLVGYGLLELVGTWSRPVMRPLFRLPGRAALDDLMSWLGSYSVGLYLTRTLMVQGAYSRRETFVVVTCFSTVSIGFVGVVASTLDLLHLFGLVFGTYFVATYALAALLCRTWPATSLPHLTVAGEAPPPEPEAPEGLWRLGWQRALDVSSGAPAWPQLVLSGTRDGTVLAASILGTILVVGTGALVVAEHTPVFVWLGRPLVGVLQLMQIPDAETVAPAVVAGITEMYIPALLVKDCALPARFFICTLSISQLVFFSSVGPMMIEMFREVPVRARDLVALFLVRTALLVPALAAWTWLLGRMGVFG
jgi:nucleoside recognition membrane protein YjiH